MSKRITKPPRVRGFDLADFRRELLERAEGTSSDFHALTVDFDRLEVDVLAALGGAVRVAARLTEVGALASEETDARHRRLVRMGIG